LSYNLIAIRLTTFITFLLIMSLEKLDTDYSALDLNSALPNKNIEDALL